MKIGSEIVGVKLKEYTAEVTWRQTTNYAAAVADDNPIYLDDLREGGIIAPPMFAATFTWSIVGKLSAYANLPYPQEIFHTLVQPAILL